jgi:hypothetical protein
LALGRHAAAIGVGWAHETRSASTSAATGRAVTLDIDVAVLQQRIAKAEADRETWRASGMQENYLEACSMVDALNVQLDDLERAARRVAAASATMAEPKLTL